MKKGSMEKMIKTRAIKSFWDDCLELKCYISFIPAHGIYKLDEDVPKTILSQESSKISQFCEFDWFEWVMFQDKMASYQDDHFTMGK